MGTEQRMLAAARIRALKACGQTNLEIYRMFRDDYETAKQLADERIDRA